MFSTLRWGLLFIPLSLFAADGVPTLQQIEDSGKIRIGYRETLPPMSYIDENGQASGYSIDLCSHVVDEIKKKLNDQTLGVEFVSVNAENRFSALADNEIDILCGATTKTLSRSELVDFSQLTFITGAGFLSLKEVPIITVPDLQGRKIAVVKDTTTKNALDRILAQTGTDTEVVLVDSSATGLQMLESGEVAAYTADQIVLIGMLFNAHEPERYFVGGNLYSFEPLALAVRKNDSDFRLIADRVLSHLYRSGEIRSIYGKWFGRISDKIPSAIAATYEINATPE